MSLPDQVFHEYMPSPKSMAGQLYDVENVIKQKYLSISNQDYSGCPYKLLQVEDNLKDLNSLLSLNTNDILKNIVETLAVDIKKNVRKDLLVLELAGEIAKNFALLLVPAREMQGYAKSVEYLIRRGYLFQCLSHDEEVLLLPEELQHILDRLAESEMGRDTERKIKRQFFKKQIWFFNIMPSMPGR